MELPFRSLRRNTSVKNAGADEIAPVRLTAASISKINNSASIPHLSASFFDAALPVNFFTVASSLFVISENTSLTRVSSSFFVFVFKEVLGDS